MNLRVRRGGRHFNDPSQYKHFSYYVRHLLLLPSLEHPIPNILRHILHGQLCIDFGCFYGSMPHHDLQHFFGYSLPESHRAGECMAGNVCSKGERTAESQAFSSGFLR